MSADNISDLRQDWDLARYAGSEQEQMVAREKVIAKAIRQLPECVPLDRTSGKDLWRWTHRWNPVADREEVARAVLNGKPEAMEWLKAAVERTRLGPEILARLRAQWKEINQPVIRQQVPDVQRRRKNLIGDAIVRLPDVARDIAFFKSRPNDAPICKWSKDADRENIAEAVLGYEPDAIDRLCVAMEPPVIPSGYDVILEMQTQWSSVKDSVNNIGVLRYAQEYDPHTGEVEDITLESVKAARRKARANVMSYAIARLPAVAAQIAPLRWRRSVNAEDIAEAVLNGDEDAMDRLFSAVIPGQW